MLIAQTRSRLFAVVALVAGIAVSMGCSGSSGNSENVDTMPEVVFEGGGGEVSIQFEVNQPSVLKASFAQYDDEGMDEQSIYAAEDIEPGSYTRTVDVSPDTYVYFEIGVPEAAVGATLNMVVAIDGQEVYRESDRLADPLGKGYAFFVQFEADDTDQIRSWIR